MNNNETQKDLIESQKKIISMMEKNERNDL